jgi:hypothetical protein
LDDPGSHGVLAHVVSFLGKNNDMIFGTTFNSEYAQFLGLNPREVFKTIVEDWRFKHIRLSAQWDLIEKKPGEYDFVELDWMIREAMEHQSKIILAVGQKTPRWPECHTLTWAQKLNHEQYYAALLKFINVVVERYKQSPALEIWQVENEPFLAFGTCLPFDKQMLDEEIALVKKLDPNHPTLTSDSGELSTWRRTAKAADFFGTTMYRVVWNKYVKYWNYDWLPASFYRLKLFLNGRSVDNSYIMELQAEPWIPNGMVHNTPLQEQYRSMDLKRLQKNVDFARRVGMPRTYLWGAEWWYWLEQQGNKDIVEYIRTLPKE